MNLYMIEIDRYPEIEGFHDNIEELPIEAESLEMAFKIAEKYIQTHYLEPDSVTYQVREIEEEQPASEGIKDATAEVLELVLDKNRRYGNDNLTTHGHLGIIVRVSDKLARIKNMSKADEKNKEEYEKARRKMERDYMDIAGYGILGLKLMREGRL